MPSHTGTESTLGPSQKGKCYNFSAIAAFAAKDLIFNTEASTLDDKGGKISGQPPEMSNSFQPFFYASLRL